MHFAIWTSLRRWTWHFLRNLLLHVAVSGNLSMFASYGLLVQIARICKGSTWTAGRATASIICRSVEEDAAWFDYLPSQCLHA
ncbi:hypothetical protein F4809DRAFT_149040 [Biscogniauxia mediterranea]|nr:hypothetical protein F4809DRAFT_149040 [Biscogniauxia mediterranea]